MTIPTKPLLDQLLAETARRHKHLCPRQVLGVRLGLIGLSALNLGATDAGPFRNRDKQLLSIVETDGCGADGIAVATDCAVGRRTLRVLDFGKVAVTLVDCCDNRAVRVAPTNYLRELAPLYAPAAPSPWHAYLLGYQVIPDEEIATVRLVTLTQPLEEILSRPDARICCDRCGEEIINEREVRQAGAVLCRHCAGHQYYEEG